MIQVGIVRQRIADLAADPSGAYHTDSAILRHISTAAKEITREARCLHRGSSFRLLEGQFAYALPDDFLEMQAVRMVRPDGTNYELTHTIFTEILELNSGSLYGSKYPIWYDVFLDASLEKYTGGVVSATGDTIVLDGEDWLIQTTDVVIDVTDPDTEGQIESVQKGGGQTTLTYSGLDGTPSGDIRIIDLNAPLKSLQLAPTPQADDDEDVESLRIWMAYEHPEVTSYTDVLNLDSEFETALVHRSLYWMRYAEVGGEDASTQIALRDYRLSYQTAYPRVNRRVKARFDRWGRSVRLRRQVRRQYIVEGSKPGVIFTADIS